MPLHPLCSILYELFTLESVVQRTPPVLIAVNKSDLPAARAVSQVRSILEAELCVPVGG